MKKTILFAITFFSVVSFAQVRPRPTMTRSNMEMTCANFLKAKVEREFGMLTDGIEASSEDYTQSLLGSFVAYKYEYERECGKAAPIGPSDASQRRSDSIITILNQFPGLADIGKNQSLGYNDQFVRFLLTELQKARVERDSLQSEKSRLEERLRAALEPRDYSAQCDCLNPNYTLKGAEKDGLFISVWGQGKSKAAAIMNAQSQCTAKTDRKLTGTYAIVDHGQQSFTAHNCR